MITNCHKNNMGTVSFDAQFPGMRKPQDFIVYPMPDSGKIISIQSDTRWGQLDLATGRGLLSAAKADAGLAWFLVCRIRKHLTAIELPAEDLEMLRQWIKSTGGLLVGDYVKTDNTGALAL